MDSITCMNTNTSTATNTRNTTITDMVASVAWVWPVTPSWSAVLAGGLGGGLGWQPHLGSSTWVAINSLNVVIFRHFPHVIRLHTAEQSPTSRLIFNNLFYHL
ncbi:hypothetical protein BVC80_7045g1 [Macleaya cordata]|uniref:Uncharacterized protein n=1 Tax=Macleaya cordata TaxID=56857 RepID=A0A200PMZ8_MACCD|nr:hypothetical protein BVC80_7045g1 [Macleaya cordata]